VRPGAGRQPKSLEWFVPIGPIITRATDILVYRREKLRLLFNLLQCGRIDFRASITMFRGERSFDRPLSAQFTLARFGAVGAICF
jgi:hypothetical protein